MLPFFHFSSQFPTWVFHFSWKFEFFPLTTLFSEHQVFFLTNSDLFSLKIFFSPHIWAFIILLSSCILSFFFPRKCMSLQSQRTFRCAFPVKLWAFSQNWKTFWREYNFFSGKFMFLSSLKFLRTLWFYIPRIFKYISNKWQVFFHTCLKYLTFFS